MSNDYLLNKRILLVDDEQGLLDMVLSILTEYGFSNIQTAQSVKEAIAEAEKKRPELAILDVMLPDGNGFDLMEQLRQKSDYPILFLTARGEDEDKFRGFGLGADDYIVKPFSNAELLMRVKAILRRNNLSNNVSYEKDTNKIPFVDAFLDTNRQCIIKNDDCINLTYTEFKILELLLNNRKQIFSLEQIYQSIWNENAVGDDAIMVHIKNIRKKIDDNSRNPKYIKTAWGRGYYVD